MTRVGTQSRRGPKADRELFAAIGDRVHSRRKSLGLSLKGLAALAGCTHVMIVYIEAGSSAPSASLTVPLCRALGWTPNDLFGWEASS